MTATPFSDVHSAPTPLLLRWLASGQVLAGIDKREQRHWLLEAAFEVADREGPWRTIELLSEKRLPSDSVGALIEAGAPALSDPRARDLVQDYLRKARDDYVIATALRILAAKAKGEVHAEVAERARRGLSHSSPLVRIASLTVAMTQSDWDRVQIVLTAMQDIDPMVRKAVLDLADELAACGELDAHARAKILRKAAEDPDPGVREFATSREALIDAVR